MRTYSHDDVMREIHCHVVPLSLLFFVTFYRRMHGLRTLREEIAFTARPKIHSHSQIYRYGRSIFCLPHWPNFSDIFDLCLHWVSVVRGFIIAFLLKFRFNNHYHRLNKTFEFIITYEYRYSISWCLSSSSKYGSYLILGELIYP